MRLLRHPNVARVVDVVSTRKHLYLVQERGGTVLDDAVRRYEIEYAFARVGAVPTAGARGGNSRSCTPSGRRWFAVPARRGRCLGVACCTSSTRCYEQWCTAMSSRCAIATSAFARHFSGPAIASSSLVSRVQLTYVT